MKVSLKRWVIIDIKYVQVQNKKGSLEYDSL